MTNFFPFMFKDNATYNDPFQGPLVCTGSGARLGGCFLSEEHLWLPTLAIARGLTAEKLKWKMLVRIDK